MTINGVQLRKHPIVIFGAPVEQMLYKSQSVVQIDLELFVRNLFIQRFGFYFFSRSGILLWHKKFFIVLHIFRFGQKFRQNLVYGYIAWHFRDHILDSVDTGYHNILFMWIALGYG